MMASSNELQFMAHIGMAMAGFTEIIWGKFKNKNKGGEQGARDASLGSSYNRPKREIGR
jgi:hypothetical protein